LAFFTLSCLNAWRPSIQTDVVKKRPIKSSHSNTNTLSIRGCVMNRFAIEEKSLSNHSIMKGGESKPKIHFSEYRCLTKIRLFQGGEK
jgi:hypothetical protein